MTIPSAVRFVNMSLYFDQLTYTAPALMLNSHLCFQKLSKYKQYVNHYIFIMVLYSLVPLIPGCTVPVYKYNLYIYTRVGTILSYSPRK